MTLDQEPWVTTFTGKRFYLRRATEQDIDIRDIAHGLSNICRYVGQCQPFYSVAEHSARMCSLAPRGVRLPVLMHDSPEAYIGDVSTKFKALMPEYNKVEKYLLTVIFSKYNIQWNPTVDALDKRIRDAEVRDLLVGGHDGWTLQEFEYGPIVPWPPAVAEAEFLRLFRELTGGYYKH